MFAGNRRLAGTGTGARLEYADIDSGFLRMAGKVLRPEAVGRSADTNTRAFLHPAAGSGATAICAGLFTSAATR